MGGAAALGTVLDLLATPYLQEWIQSKYDPQNAAAFEADLERAGPGIERKLRQERLEAQRIRTQGGVPFAIVTLHVVYRTMALPDGIGYSSYQGLSVESVEVGEAPREETHGVYEGQDVDLLDMEQWGRSFRDEQHSLVTYSFEIPDVGAFARMEVSYLAARLVDMYRYIVRLVAEEGRVVPEAVGLAREMGELTSADLSLSDRNLESLHNSLLSAGSEPGDAAQIMQIVGRTGSDAEWRGGGAAVVQ